jgi:26S proteasome regulatory subunit N1
MQLQLLSTGLVLLWNVEEGLTQIDKFLYSNEDNIRAGAALAGTLH